MDSYVRRQINTKRWDKSNDLHISQETLERVYLVVRHLKKEISVYNMIKEYKAKNPFLSKEDLRKQLNLALDIEDNEEGEGINFVSITPSTSSKDQAMKHVNEDIYPDLKDI